MAWQQVTKTLPKSDMKTKRENTITKTHQRSHITRIVWKLLIMNDTKVTQLA